MLSVINEFVSKLLYWRTHCTAQFIKYALEVATIFSYIQGAYFKIDFRFSVSAQLIFKVSIKKR